MLFLVFFITTFVAVISDDLLGVSYYFDENYFKTFSEIQCVNTTQWELVSYRRLELMPPYDGGSVGIRALSNSCATSFPVVFLKGTLNVRVYLRTVSKYSGITISVFDEQDEVMASARYQRSNKKFVPGWTIIVIPIERNTTGYVQISGQSLSSELVIVDSLRYEPNNSANRQSDEQTVTNNELKDTPPPNFLNDWSIHDEFISCSDENDDVTDEEGSAKCDVELESQTEDPEDPDIDNSNEEPSSEEDTEILETNGFWNAFTITLLSVGAFTVVGLLSVGSYYLGNNRGMSENPPLDIDALEAPSEIIPRARSVFSDVTYDTEDIAIYS